MGLAVARTEIEGLFETLAEKSPVGVYIVQDGKFCYANPAFQSCVGYWENELVGMDSLEFVFPEDREMVRENAIKMLKGEVTSAYPLRLIHKTGSIGWVMESVSSIQYGGRRATLGNHMDITERKNAEEATRQAAQEWRETFDSISDAISIHGKDYRIRRANRAFADIFDMEPDQAIGKHCYELHKGTKPISGCPHQQTLASKKPAVAEFYESHLGKHLLESTSPILDMRGEVVGTVHVTRDITKQKELNEQLMMADRLASVGELAAGAAHELNNPLTSILGFSRLLMEKKVSDDVREDLEIICSEAQRATEVIKQLLEVAREHQPVKQPNQMNRIVEDVLKLRAHEHRMHNIKVERRLATALPEIMVDYSQDAAGLLQHNNQRRAIRERG
jgi:PAS domain S-box-containing protein